MTVLTQIPNGAALKDVRDTFNAALADIAELKAGGGTGTPTPTPTPPPSITTPAAINSDGTPQVGEQLTGVDPVFANATISTRRWLKGSTALATTNAYTPDATGVLTWTVTGLGTDGSTITSSSNVTVAAATVTPTPTPTTVTPLAAVYADTFDAAGQFAARANWAGDTGAWEAINGYARQKNMYGGAVQVVFGGDVGEQALALDYNTSGAGGGGPTWEEDRHEYRLWYKDDNNYIRGKINTDASQRVTAFQLGFKVNGSFTGYRTFYRPPWSTYRQIGRIEVHMAGGQFRVKFDGEWARNVTGRDNYPFDRISFDEVGMAAGQRAGKFTMIASTWTYAIADGVAVFSDEITVDAVDEFVGPDSTAYTQGTTVIVGTLLGSPTAWSYRLDDFDTGAEVSGWATLTNVEVSAGIYTATLKIPFNKRVRVTLAWIGADGFARTIQTKPIACGYVVAYYGQSNSRGRSSSFNDRLGDRYYSYTEPNTQQNNSFPERHFSSLHTGFRPSIAGEMARVIAEKTGVLTAVVVAGFPGVGISGVANGVNAGRPTEDLSRSVGIGYLMSFVRGICSLVVWDQGENDAHGNPYTANYVDIFLNTLIPNLKTACKNPDVKVLIAMVGRFASPTPPSQTWDTIDQQTNRLRQDYLAIIAQNPSVSMSAHKLGCKFVGTDPYHYEVSMDGYGEACRRDGFSAAKLLGANTHDGYGARIVAGERVNGKLRMKVDLNGGTGITDAVDKATSAASPAPVKANTFKGYQFSTDNFATLLQVSGIAPAGNDLDVTFTGGLPAGQIKFRSFYGGSYQDESLFYTTYAGGDAPIPIGPILTPLTA